MDFEQIIVDGIVFSISGSLDIIKELPEEDLFGVDFEYNEPSIRETLQKSMNKPSCNIEFKSNSESKVFNESKITGFTKDYHFQFCTPNTQR